MPVINSHGVASLPGIPTSPGVIAFLAALLMLVACSTTEAPVDVAATTPEKTVEEKTVATDADLVANSIVRIVGFGCGAPALGSGFAVAEHVLVTSGHLVTGRDPETLAVVRPDGSEFPAVLIAFDPDLDLAFLRVDDVAFEPVELLEEVPDVSGIAIGLRTELDEQYVNEVAFEIDGAVTVNWDGVFRDTESTFQGVRLHADIQRGDSGTALFTSGHQVVGLIHSTSRNGVDRGYAVSSAQISDYYSTIDINAEVIADRCA